MERYFGNASAAVCGVSRRATIEQTSGTADRSEESRKRLGLFAAKWFGGAFLFSKSTVLSVSRVQIPFWAKLLCVEVR